MQINTRDDLIKVLRESLRFNVQQETNYTGGMGPSGGMYEKCTTLQIVLDDEIICEAVISN